MSLLNLKTGGCWPPSLSWSNMNIEYLVRNMASVLLCEARVMKLSKIILQYECSLPYKFEPCILHSQKAAQLVALKILMKILKIDYSTIYEPIEFKLWSYFTQRRSYIKEKY